MLKYGSLIKVRPEYEERYIILHKHTFPGVLERIHKCNIRNYSIFLRDGMLYSYFEYIGENFDEDMKNMADEVTQDWWKLTDPMQEPLECRKEGEWWASMETWFHYGEKNVNSPEAKRYVFVAVLPSEKQEEYKQNLQEIGQDVLEQISEAHIQNVSVYFLDGSVYLYLEYTGEDFESDENALFDHANLKPWQPDWQPMREVFHTD